jgi:16S rRNA (cytosine967-C5)-methyltransferase
LGLRAGAAAPERGGPIPDSVRGLALRILSRVDRGEAYADILLDRTLRREDLPDSRDRALLTELVMGTLRRRGTLDHTVSPHLGRPLDRMDPVVRNALRLGTYQLLYMRLPERAALFETVEAVKAVRGGKPAGFVNAVLRGVVRAGKEPLLPEGDGMVRKAVELSAPLFLLESLVRSMGEEEAFVFLAEALKKPPFTIRVNPFRTSRESLLARFAAAGAEPVPCRYAPDGIVLRKPIPVHADPGFRAGEYIVMDEGAQLVSYLLAPRAGETVLDACAAPGGKATHLSAIAGGKAVILAADVSMGRARLLRETVSRTGAPGVETAVHDFAAGPLPGAGERFDKILVDAPCTGVGVIGRNPDAKWRFDPEAPVRMARLQRALLASAWASLKAGGLLVYCTCSPLREENEEVVEAFLEGISGAAAVEAPPSVWPGPPDAVVPGGFVRLYPHRHGTDAFFAALLRKRDGPGVSRDGPGVRRGSTTEGPSSHNGGG